MSTISGLSLSLCDLTKASCTVCGACRRLFKELIEQQHSDSTECGLVSNNETDQLVANSVGQCSRVSHL